MTGEARIPQASRVGKLHETGRGALMRRVQSFVTAAGKTSFRILLTGLLVIVGLPLSGCTRTVAWEEEVLLNTGESLNVQRQVAYTLGGAPGNPMDIGWNQKRGAEMRFSWRGRNYVFKEHNNPLLLAISPQGVPVVVINPEIGSWDRLHKLPCRTPGYVQFVPDATGERWTWPDAVDPWLYWLPSNLLQELPRPGRSTARYRHQDVRAANAALRISAHDRFIDPQFTDENCPKGAKQ